MPIINFGIMADFSVTVIDDRPVFADKAKKAGAHKVLCQDFKSALEEIEIDGNTYFVIVTRGHRYDRICLETIIQKPKAYVGMIGSKVRVSKVKNELLEKRVDPKKIKEIYTPIGLNIKAETPVEIAIAIMGEIILVKNERKIGSGYSKGIINELINRPPGKKGLVLATIVSREGSAPREVGTKMLVYPDGRMMGTIGGGCAESDVMRKALNLFTKKNTNGEMVQVDMTGLEAEEDAWFVAASWKCF
ncbi:xanthine dehydrogenase [Isachenkonia alkalipeptolytica]|uniref:Xanthine dehydrogenase n=2 Tax=Isachenkonia alkalipeptolytica TaxID=2565777 RepID=A0AA43XPN2_9CLOT|nr:xanthine dehydrogenase [Isachenkonia alkalipeptolytica]